MRGEETSTNQPTRRHRSHHHRSESSGAAGDKAVFVPSSSDDAGSRERKGDNHHETPEFSSGTDSNVVKILVMGLNGVGKTAIVVRFLTQRYIGEYDHSPETIYRFNCRLGGNASQTQTVITSKSGGGGVTSNPDPSAPTTTVSVEIVDCGVPGAFIGRDSKTFYCLHLASCFVRLNESRIRWADALVFVYSITSRKSFQLLAEMRRQTLELRNNPLFATLMLGSKCELEHLREVSKKEAEQLGQEWGYHYAEISAAEDPQSVHRVMRRFLKIVFTLQQQQVKSILPPSIQSIPPQPSTVVAAGLTSNSQPNVLETTNVTVEKSESTEKLKQTSTAKSRSKSKGDRRGKRGASNSAVTDDALQTSSSSSMAPPLSSMMANSQAVALLVANHMPKQGIINKMFGKHK